MSLTPPPSIAPNSSLIPNPVPVSGRIVREGNGQWYEIDRVDVMPPFLMTLASDSDHWLFLLSNGGLTAGRGNPDGALFPYYTQDKLLDMLEGTGSLVLIRMEADGQVWEPFARQAGWNEGARQKLRKNDLGSHIELEETQVGSGLTCRISWRPSERFGFVRKVELVNAGPAPVRISLLDGLLNILPPGLSQRFQNEFSILGDAYKQAQLVDPGNLGVFHLSSVPTDLAEPMEALRATTVWQTGLGEGPVALTDSQLARFRLGGEMEGEVETRGRRTAFLNARKLDLPAGGKAAWHVCADVGKARWQVEELQQLLRAEEDLAGMIEQDCRRTEDRLRGMLAAADGLQCTAKSARAMRHTSNTLFNLMRGGTFLDGYRLPATDALKTVANFNRKAAAFLEKSGLNVEGLNCSDPWKPGARERFGRDAMRLLREYLPLSFSRRHGDPSRPWNRFSIDIKHPDGSAKLSYQGNWRDIFQNWEALLLAYPEYAEAAISRFLNASTADGYNPYRVTKEGFEWEVMDPKDPWANIGYWGDHQIVYLLRLLELSNKFHPDRLAGLFGEDSFVYAEIPYRIRHYNRILENPRETVDFDEEWESRILSRTKQVGEDGKLLHSAGGNLVYVGLLEKLLTPLLAKLSNFVPGGGIWMNTQRPEWNDANNALVGYGVSVVTLGYVARYLRFLLQTFRQSLQMGSFQVSREVADLLLKQARIFAGPAGECSDGERKTFMDQLGESASVFREQLYNCGLSGEKARLNGDVVIRFLEAARTHVEDSLRRNRRPDALWHSYNLLRPVNGGMSLDRLDIMLEGQVSILSSALLDASETLDLFRNLRSSALYREDQDSYLLYPDRKATPFLARNHIPRNEAEAIPLLARMLDQGDGRIIHRLPDGGACFNGAFHNSKDLQKSLEQIPEVREDPEAAGAIMELFEKTFKHRHFTGRSGTFFAYEGLGSIYWHMVSKLVLAAQECCLAFQESASAEQLSELACWYRQFRDGLGVEKNPSHYGAIPTDAYSHTPAHSGAQQPGMTGQVKEDILIRLAELGVSVSGGRVSFRPLLLEAGEFLSEPTRFRFIDLAGQPGELNLEPGTLAFTFCQVPVVYRIGKTPSALTVLMKNGETIQLQDNQLTESLSSELFRRTGRIRQIRVDLGETNPPAAG